MISLEFECSQIAEAGLADKSVAARAVAMERREIFSVFEELRFVLYGAVAAIVGGVGLIVKDHLDRIGPVTLIAVLALAAAACYAVALRARLKGKERSVGGDYVLLLGAMIVSADVAYAESQFHWLGTEWQWYLLMLAAFHAATAYGLRSPLVLSAAIAALVAWFGIEGRNAILFTVSVSSVSLGVHALICSVTLLAWRVVNRRLGGPRTFAGVFDNFVVNVGFWGAATLVLNAGSRLAGLVVLSVVAAGAATRAVRSGEQVFVAYAVVYSALILCWLEGQLVEPFAAALLLQLTTVVSGTLLLWLLHGVVARRR